jgi:hypothetical protein
MYEVPTSISIVDPFFAAPTTRAMKSPQAVMLHGDSFGLSIMTSDGWPFLSRLVRALTKTAPDARLKFLKGAALLDFFMLSMICRQSTVLNASTCVAG